MTLIGLTVSHYLKAWSHELEGLHVMRLCSIRSYISFSSPLINEEAVFDTAFKQIPSLIQSTLVSSPTDIVVVITESVPLLD